MYGAMHEESSWSRTMDLGPVCGERAFSLEGVTPEGPVLFVLSSSPATLGSARGVDIRIRDAAVSGRHCELVARPQGVFVRDVGSRNGTYVGGARITEAWALAGTMMTVGRTVLRVAAEERVPEGGDLVPLASVVGASRAMRVLAARVRRLANLPSPVLILGETGTGKELIARSLHTEGHRARAPFIPVNVAALPRELVESELFGHERGAFTGAVSRRAGVFSEAGQGTVFLDEIGELPLDAQPKLLRALDGYDVRRVGGTGAGRTPIARVVAATHVSLEEAVLRGTFRRDLFHRLEVFVVEIPPLRARKEDIPLLARHLLGGERELSSRATARLVAHDFPGNVRELRNVLLRACETAAGNVLEGADIERAMSRGPRLARPTLTPVVARALLKEHHGNLSHAAKAAGIPRTTFRRALSES